MKKIAIGTEKIIYLCLFVLTGFISTSSAKQNDKLKIPSAESILLQRIEKLESETRNLSLEVTDSEQVLEKLKAQLVVDPDLSKLVIVESQKLGSSYSLVESIYYLDGRRIAELKSESLDAPVFSKSVSPGRHRISVEKLYQKHASSALDKPIVLQLKGSKSVLVSKGNETRLEVAATLDKNAAKRGREKLRLELKAKLLELKSEKKIAVLIKEELLDAKNSDNSESRVSIVLRKVTNPAFILRERIVFIDGVKVKLINPSVITDQGDVILDEVVASGEHEVHAEVNFAMQGGLSKKLNTSLMSFKFSKAVLVKPGYKTTVYLKPLPAYNQVALPETKALKRSKV